MAERMSGLVCTMDGFVDQSFYEASDGERVTVVRFRDAPSHRAWALHPAHRDAQRRGREALYSWYDISVSEEWYSHIFDGEAI